MKVGIIVSNLSMGGAQKVAMLLNEWLNEHKILTKLIALKQTQKKEYPYNKMPIVYLRSNNYFSAIKELRTVVKNEHFDIILVMGVPMCIYVIPALLKLKCKIIVSERNDPNNFAGRAIIKFLSRQLMLKADGYVFQTDEARNYYLNKLKRTSVVIPNPITDKNIPSIYKGERKKEIVAVGRLVDQKNYKLMISAFNDIKDQFPEYKLKIYGEGEMYSELKNQINNYNLETRVFLCGVVNNVLEKIKAASLFIMCSDFEGMPNALLEAMAVGLPCISTDCPCGGPRELITDELNGKLIKVNNQEELSNGIKKLLSDKELRERISLQAIYVKDKYSVNKICSHWLEYFKYVDGKKND